MLAALLLSLVAYTDEPARTVHIFEAIAIQLDRDLTDPTIADSYVLRKDGRIAEATIDLPPAATDQRGAQRIMLTVAVEPRLIEVDGKFRPGDPWTRMGNITLIDGEDEIELMRFITGFGGPGTFTQDVTALAPLLRGKSTIRAYITTYASPGWNLSASLQWFDEGAGYRRPVFAKHLFNEQHVSAEDNVLRATVNIQDGLDTPRIRVISTGHATDGAGGDEFITRTHILRVNGHEVARWRPWAERGGSLRGLNPMSGRQAIDGRMLWSSDLDRSGWLPGEVVEPLVIPLPELSAPAPGHGSHIIELEIEGIRPADPADEAGEHGYWRVSAVIVADEPWPARDP